MRELKFRGKRVDNGEWVYGWYGHKEATDQHFIMIERLHDVPEYGSYFVDVEVDPETVGQFTGIKDENGTGIYEGDILRDEFDRVFKVYWVDGEARFTIRQKKRKTEYFMVISHIHPVVIGNIYENPELLKGEGQ